MKRLICIASIALFSCGEAQEVAEEVAQDSPSDMVHILITVRGAESQGHALVPKSCLSHEGGGPKFYGDGWTFTVDDDE